MGTFLVTRKMDPALAARVEASVRGRRTQAPGSGAPFAPRLVAAFRFGLVAAAGAALCFFAVFRHQEREKLEQARASLLVAVRAQSASLRAEDAGFVKRAEPWLLRFAGPYEGDLVSDDLRAPKAMGLILAQPAVYVRGPSFAFTDPATIAVAASTSVKDSFLLCLVERPESRAEKILLAKVRSAYAGGAQLEQRTASVRRLHEAEVGLPLLLPPWAERVQNAQEPEELARLKKALEKAPVEEAKQAARATLLILAMDEPGNGPGPTELDGERPHEVRIGLVDLTAAKVLLRIRKRVDPNWISMATRAQYASGLDGCALALDVHESVH